MSYGFCTQCGRSYRSAENRRRAERYYAVHAELRGGAPASHLMPVQQDAALGKIDRHRKDSQTFRQRGTP